MTEFLHILDRFIIHLFSASGVLLGTTFLVAMLQRRTHWQWLPARPMQIIVFSAVCIFAGSTLREAWDVSHGQLLIKAFTDYLSWLVGVILGSWGLYRLLRWRDQ